MPEPCPAEQACERKKARVRSRDAGISAASCDPRLAYMPGISGPFDLALIRMRLLFL